MLDERGVLCHFQLFVQITDLNFSSGDLTEQGGVISVKLVELKNTAIQKHADGCETQTDYKNFEWISQQAHVTKSKMRPGKELASFRLA